MGNCTSGSSSSVPFQFVLLRTKKKKKGDLSPEDRICKDNKEDVTYASIDHSTAQGFRRTRAAADEECDYATVHVPAALQVSSEQSAKDECESDYVLMS
ncbi:uncharacterized protein V6R79_001735 [Siganus canaliculatus]